MWWPKLMTGLSILLTLWGAAACGESTLFRAHLMAGLINANFTGAENGGFSESDSLQGQLEYLYSSHMSAEVYTALAMDPAEGQFKYVGMGLSQKFYLFSRANSMKSDAGGVDVSVDSKFRFYASLILGITEVQVKEVTSTLVAHSTLLEYGVGMGAIYQLNKRWGVEAEFGISKGLAMSSLSVDALIVRGLVGVSANF